MKLNKQQAFILNKIKAGGNYLITGGAGTGKSTLLHSLVDLHNVVFAAPTASAAMLIHGTTIHRLLQLPPYPVLTRDSLQCFRNKKQIRIIKAIKTLVIDEVSMLRSDVFAAIDYRLREYVNDASMRNIPFGGRQIILCGDFFQLPPVCSKEKINNISVAEYLEKNLGGIHPFCTPLWAQAKIQCMQLTESMRQQEKDFTDALNAIRIADQSKLDNALAVINTRVTKDIPKDAIRLYPSNWQVRNFNKDAYRKLNGEEQTFHAKIVGDYGTDFPVEKEMHLKIGERVIITANIAKNVINGTSGIIQRFAGQEINVLLDEQKTVFPVPLYTFKRYAYKTVFDERENKDVIRPYEAGSFTQYPLTPGYAITIHRSQGMTLSKVAPTLHFSFASGLSYVALSRCRRLQDLYLPIPVKKDLIAVSQEVIDSYFLVEYDIVPFTIALKKAALELMEEKKWETINFNFMAETFLDCVKKICAGKKFTDSEDFSAAELSCAKEIYKCFYRFPGAQDYEKLGHLIENFFDCEDNP